MDSKIVVFICTMGVASASVVAPALVARPDPLPQYSYGYDVQDALTGDYKGHQEHRNGDLVTGSYSVVDPDGTRRVVDYSADPLNGFNAVVRREPLIVPAPARVVGPAQFFGPAPVAPAPVGPAQFFSPAPGAPAPVGPAQFFSPAPVAVAPAAPAPHFAPAPYYQRAPIYAPAPTPAHLFAPRLPSPYYF